jgi:hypothetical protein
MMNVSCEFCGVPEAAHRVQLRYSAIEPGKWAGTATLLKHELGVTEVGVCAQCWRKSLSSELWGYRAGAVIGTVLIISTATFRPAVALLIGALLWGVIELWWPSTPAALKSVRRRLFSHIRARLAAKHGRTENEMRPILYA